MYTHVHISWVWHVRVACLQVIGINTAIRANAAGIGFAIPIDTAEKAMRELSQVQSPAFSRLLPPPPTFSRPL